MHVSKFYAPRSRFNQFNQFNSINKESYGRRVDLLANRNEKIIATNSRIRLDSNR